MPHTMKERGVLRRLSQRGSLPVDLDVEGGFILFDWGIYAERVSEIATQRGFRGRHEGCVEVDVGWTEPCHRADGSSDEADLAPR